MTDPEQAELTAPPAVVVSGLSTSYGRGTVITDVSFRVEPGRTLVVMGASGAGKTTLIKTMLGLLDPDQGTVRIGRQNMHAKDGAGLRMVRRSSGVLLGGSHLYDGSVFGSKTAWENVRYALEARGYDTATADGMTRERMAEFGLTEHATKMPDQLSSGTRRRLGLATALVASPSLIVLDDPATGVDRETRLAIISSIRSARQNTSATMILVCHDIGMARALGDQMIVLLGGCVVASGPVEELLDGVDDVDTFDERFSFSRAFAEADADEHAYGRVAADRDAQHSWLMAVYVVLFLAVAGYVVALWAQWTTGVSRW